MSRIIAGGEEWIYLYTADDERVWHFKIGANPRFDRWTLRDLSGKVLREYTATGYTWSVAEDYVYRGSLLIAAETAAGRRHFHLDHLGTPRLITDEIGQQDAYHVYYPFGEEATAFDQDTERMKFTGHERDIGNLAGVGDDLDYMHARYYSPLTARFLSTDPRIYYQPLKSPQRWNRYVYSIGNPLKFKDRDGEDLTIVYDFSQTKMPDLAQTKLMLDVRKVFIKAGVRNVQSLVKGGSVKPKTDKPSDRVVNVKITDEIIRSRGGNVVYGRTPRRSNISTVSTHLAPPGEEGHALLVNVTTHEIGHGTLALPDYANDCFAVGSPLYPENAESGTIMEQGVPIPILSEEIREFSEEDAGNLRAALNEPLKK
ncbi:MAG: hypothetical protein GY847_24555 [Proteobacteria bacterium]|nr:hypothetical protein [Pseudomonadota bacterium]